MEITNNPVLNTLLSEGEVIFKSISLLMLIVILLAMFVFFVLPIIEQHLEEKESKRYQASLFYILDRVSKVMAIMTTWAKWILD